LEGTNCDSASLKYRLVIAIIGLQLGSNKRTPGWVPG
jgi:hypothetical protein